MKLKNLKETTWNYLIKQDINHQNIVPVNEDSPPKKSLRITEQSTKVQQYNKNSVRDYINFQGNRIKPPLYVMTTQQKLSIND